MDVKDRLRKDNISVSIRRDKYKDTLKRLIGTKDDSRDMSEKIWNAVDYFNKKHLQDGGSMTKGKLRDFIKEHFDVPKDKNLEDKSKAFLQGYLSIRLSDKGVDIGLNEMDQVDLNYIVGLLEGSDSKADAARLVNNSTETFREDIEELREERLNIGDSKDDKSVKELREEREKLYDGIDERVERMVKDKVAEGKDEVTALREARFELFSEDN